MIGPAEIPRQARDDRAYVKIRWAQYTGLLTDIWRRRDLFALLIGRNLKIRYKGSVLGFFWSLLGPVLLILIYATFLAVMRFEIPLATLVVGIVVWQFFATCLNDSLHAIVGNASLVTKSAFPRGILPAAMVAANLVNFLLSLSVVAALLIVARADVGPVWCLPLLVLTQTALCLGLALAVCAANVFFRDTEHILQIAMLAWFFLTPVIYPVATVLSNAAFPPWVQVLFFANPMTGILTAYRIALLSDPNPGTALLLLSFAVAWAAPLAGWMVFRGAEPRFGDEL